VPDPGEFEMVEKEERHVVFLDYNQNAKDRTTCSAYSVRPLPRCARVHAAALERGSRIAIRRTSPVLTVPKRFAEIGDPHADIDAAAGSLEKLLELAAKDEEAGLGDAALAAALSQDGGRKRRGLLRQRGEIGREESGGEAVAYERCRSSWWLTRLTRTPALEGLESGGRQNNSEAAKLLAVGDDRAGGFDAEGGRPRGPAFV